MPVLFLLLFLDLFFDKLDLLLLLESLLIQSIENILTLVSEPTMSGLLGF